jgi:hypothetical protein
MITAPLWVSTQNSEMGFWSCPDCQAGQSVIGGDVADRISRHSILMPSCVAIQLSLLRKCHSHMTGDTRSNHSSSSAAYRRDRHMSSMAITVIDISAGIAAYFQVDAKCIESMNIRGRKRS